MPVPPPEDRDAPAFADADGPVGARTDAWWAERAAALVDWFRTPDETRTGSFAGADVSWFPGGRLNVAWNCLDRHLERHAERPALIWEGDDEGAVHGSAHAGGPATGGVRRWTYAELHDETCRFANALKGIGVRRGDRVCLYLPVVPEAIVAMLACARIGAVHALVYAGFPPDALAERLRDGGCSVVVTADHALRGGRRVPLKANVDIACADVPCVRRVVVVGRGPGAAGASGADPDPGAEAGQEPGRDAGWIPGRDLDYRELVQRASADCVAVEMESGDPLFILYTSGSSGKPKGVVHAGGGYLVHVAATYADVFAPHGGTRHGRRPGAGSREVHWCAADLGWITAHSYGVYGPLANAATTLLYEGPSIWPDPGRWWRIVQRHRVTTLYTAPTALRSLMASGDRWLADTDRSSLRLLASVGEPIDATSRAWYGDAVGEGRCTVIDTWWQTETGGIVVASAPGESGAGLRALPGLVPGLVDGDGTRIEGAGSGELLIEAPWPGQAVTLWEDHERYARDYLDRHPGAWATGDGARRDADGGWHLTGRLDDVLMLDGHRVPAAAIEAVLAMHPRVLEAAVVGRTVHGEHQRVQAWVRTMGDDTGDIATMGDAGPASAALRAELHEAVRVELGDAAVPELIRFAPRLPKTRSGKIMRRMLERIARRELDDLGDTSTLADPDVVDALLADELRHETASPDGT